MLYSDLNKKATIQKARQFLENDFQRIRRYASYENLISSPKLDGQPKSHNYSNPDNGFINHASNKEIQAIIIKAMSACTEDGPMILKQKYIGGELAYITYGKLNISSATYSRFLNQALLEFADCLYFLTKDFGDDCIDLRVKRR